MPRSIALDANLLILLVVGLVDRDLIQTHKRTKSFEPADFDLLTSILAGYDEIVVTPNVLTETSNLLAQVREPARTRLMRQLALIVPTQREEYVASAEVTRHPDFVRLGLTDCGLLDVVGDELVMLTTDHDLYMAASRQNAKTINFNHLRQRRLLGR